VCIVRRRQSGPDVNELPHPIAPRQVSHRPPKELPVSHSPIDDLRPLLDHLGRYGTVGLEVVLSIQPDVVYAGRMRHGGIERR
jgi:hypothetical protein